MKKSLFAVALAFMSLSAVAQADEYVTTQTNIAQIDVRYDDLNLSNRAGARTMLSRIEFAAVRVCGGKPDLREVAVVPLFKSCVRIATDDAIDQLGAPLVAKLYFEHAPQDSRLAYQEVRQH